MKCVWNVKVGKDTQALKGERCLKGLVWKQNCTPTRAQIGIYLTHTQRPDVLDPGLLSCHGEIPELGSGRSEECRASPRGRKLARVRGKVVGAWQWKLRILASSSYLEAERSSHQTSHPKQAFPLQPSGECLLSLARALPEKPAPLTRKPFLLLDTPRD